MQFFVLLYTKNTLLGYYYHITAVKVSRCGCVCTKWKSSDLSLLSRFWRSDLLPHPPPPILLSRHDNMCGLVRFFPSPRTNYRQVCSHSNYNSINNNAPDDPRQRRLLTARRLGDAVIFTPRHVLFILLARQSWTRCTSTSPGFT